MTNPYQGSGDTGSGDIGVNLDPHVTGNPIANTSGNVTVGHTWVIIVGAVVLLWALAYAFRNIRMG